MAKQLDVSPKYRHVVKAEPGAGSTLPANSTPLPATPTKPTFTKKPAQG